MSRLTDAFSKKLENQAHAVTIDFMHYNVAKVHQLWRIAPAIEAGVSAHVWSLEEIFGLLN